MIRPTLDTTKAVGYFLEDVMVDVVPSGDDILRIQIEGRRRDELEKALRDLLQFGEHDGECHLNEKGQCVIHLAMMEERRQRALNVLANQ